jgi:hypothetical protein
VMAPPRKPINHGTEGGFNAHYRRGDPACEPCRKAHAQRTTEWRSVLIICRDCGRERHREARGRCAGCYQRLKREAYRARNQGAWKR